MTSEDAGVDASAASAPRARRGPAVALAVVVVLVVIGGAVWWFGVRSDAPPAVQAAPCPEGGDAPAPLPAGPWTVTTGEETFAGYRIDEVFGGGVAFDQTAAGRTPAVTGELVVDGDQVTAVTVEADVTQLASDKVRRDDFIRQKALESDTFGSATFVLGEPIAVDPDAGCVNVDVTGELTLHGQTRTVSVPVTATWDGEAVRVEGSAPIVLADYGIETPDVAGMVRVAPNGTFEFSVVFEPSGA